MPIITEYLIQATVILALVAFIGWLLDNRKGGP